MNLHFVNFSDEIKDELKDSSLGQNHSLTYSRALDIPDTYEGLIFLFLIRKNEEQTAIIRDFQISKNKKCHLVLVSSFAEIAVLAWRLNCYYFIQLPFNMVEIRKCIEMASNRKTFSLSLKDGSTTHYISESEVNFLKADGNYTSLHLKGGRRILVSKKLKYFESIFSEVPGIVRIGRSFILNLRHILAIDDQLIRFQGAQSEQLKLSSRYISRIKKLLTEYIP